MGQRPLANLSSSTLIFFLDSFHFFDSFEVKSWVWFPRLSTLDLVDVVTPKRATNQSLMKGRGPVAMREVVSNKAFVSHQDQFVSREREASLQFVA